MPMAAVAPRVIGVSPQTLVPLRFSSAPWPLKPRPAIVRYLPEFSLKAWAAVPLCICKVAPLATSTLLALAGEQGCVTVMEAMPPDKGFT